MPQAGDFGSPAFSFPSNSKSRTGTSETVSFNVEPIDLSSAFASTEDLHGESISDSDKICVGHAPGVTGSVGDTPSTELSHASTLSSATHAGAHQKQMKTASKCLQFYTTIVVKSCVYVREWLGNVGTYQRAAVIFEKIECGLRDRSTYPLPPDVASRDLLQYSYHKGPDAEAEFKVYCVDKSKPLTEDMSFCAEKLYSNKFSDIRKLINNHITPKYTSIIKKLTLDGTRSGYNAPSKKILDKANEILHKER